MVVCLLLRFMSKQDRGSNQSFTRLCTFHSLGNQQAGADSKNRTLLIHLAGEIHGVVLPPGKPQRRGRSAFLRDIG